MDLQIISRTTSLQVGRGLSSRKFTDATQWNIWKNGSQKESEREMQELENQIKVSHPVRDRGTRD